MAAMANDPKVMETLEALNRGYLLAGEKADVGWYDAHLAEDYMATNPDGSLVDKAGFLARFKKPSGATNLRAPEVHIQLVGDVALIHCRFEDTKPDGQTGKGRYTDIWAKRDGRWLCVSAHFIRC
jgi:ketosteroid isomerase-like protein